VDPREKLFKTPLRFHDIADSQGVDVVAYTPFVVGVGPCRGRNADDDVPVSRAPVDERLDQSQNQAEKR